MDLIVHDNTIFHTTADDVASIEDETSTEAASVLPPEKATMNKAKIWAVGGGKGGVGKSLISANFALSLARRGRRVLAIDLDLGGSNLHTCLGIEPPKAGIGDWVAGRLSLKELVVSTKQEGLHLISGSQDSLKIITHFENRVDDLVEDLAVLEYDDIILDLGAGTHGLTIDFFNVADEGILSILPEPTSVENAYRFIRAVFYSRMKDSDVPEGVQEVIDAAMDPKNILGLRTPADLLAVIERLDPKAFEVLSQTVKNFSPNIVINQVRSQVDIDVGRAICSVCRRYFGIDVRYAGYLEYENAVWKAIRAKKPFIQEFPHTLLASRIEALTRTLLGEEKMLFP